MGQHKFNPNCHLAKEGKFPPKKPKLSKKDMERALLAYLRSNPQDIIIKEEGDSDEDRDVERL